MTGVATRVSSPQFIGRQEELATLTTALDRAATGVASTILIGGDAGIGKSRLVAEISARAAGSFLVLEGGCVSLGDGGGLPFAPIVEALRRLPSILAADPTGRLGRIEDLRSPATEELGGLIPDLGSTLGAPAGMFDRPEWVQARIFEGLLSLLRSLGERVPVLLILEDLHWADGSTRDVTSFLARNARTERLAVVGTYRTDELNRRHPLRPWLAEMDRLPRVERIGLARFGRQELEAQVAAILDDAPRAGLVEAVERRAEGNPFFVEELLACADEPELGLPQTLRDVLLSRVTALSDQAQRVLGIAAVAGRAVDSELLALVGGAPETALEDALRDALAAQILVSDPVSRTGGYRFRHALLAEAVYDDLLPSERRRLHAAYAAALDARPTPPGAEGASHLAALAHHASSAHEPVRALRAWVAAARAASGAFGFAESTRAYERAIDLWDAVPADDRPEGVDPAALYDEAALASMISGRPDRAVVFARMATELIDRAREPDRWAAANVRLSRALWVSGTMGEGLAILESTAAALEGSEPSPVHARVLAALASAHMLSGDHSRAIEVARHAIDLARTAASPVAEAHAMNTLGVSTVLIGRTDEGLALTREAFERTKTIPDAFDDVGRSYANLTSVLLIAGQAEESLARAVEGIAWARSVGAWGGYGRFVTGNAMDAAIHLGRWDQAESLGEELLAQHAVGINRIGTIAVAGPFLAQRGRLEMATEILEEGRALIGPLREAQFTAPLFAGLVELALARGNLELATSTAADGVERLRRTEDRFYVGELLAIGARAEADTAETARAGRKPAVAEQAADRAAAYVRTLREVLDEVPESDAYGGRLAAFEAVSAAEARRASGIVDPDAWRAAAATSEFAGAWTVAYTHYRLGEALLANQATRREAESVVSEAHRLASALSAMPLVDAIEAMARRGRIAIHSVGAALEPEAPKPAAAGLPESGEAADLGLTSREREVLSLVAEGYTNRRIAKTLFISESTAGVHVSNILGKLGVASRTEAATVAARLGMVH
jgi:DNA-binding CsgD family transcriptional regulator/tetratricopeptide (TPR) repeat protein